jgi:hypothetical protein
MTMLNRDMLAKLQKGEAIDVRRIGRELPGREGIFHLQRWVEGKEYCDSLRERWIWSIGKHLISGEIYASCDAQFANHPNHECLYQR